MLRCGDDVYTVEVIDEKGDTHIELGLCLDNFDDDEGPERTGQQCVVTSDHLDVLIALADYAKRINQPLDEVDRDDLIDGRETLEITQMLISSKETSLDELTRWPIPCRALSIPGP